MQFIIVYVNQSVQSQFKMLFDLKELPTFLNILIEVFEGW